VFVTHDIDEAIKMGDRIAILREGSHIAQYDTPERILVNPADEFVADFIGRGASLKRLSLSRVRDIALGEWTTVADGTDHDEARRILQASDKGCLLVLDAQRRPRSWVSAEHLARPDRRPLAEIGLPLATVEPRATLSDTLNEMITARYSTAVVIDESGAYAGVVDFDTINEAIRGMRTAERDRLRGDLDPATADATGVTPTP
jgi:osmoprotectant transport system ATP-binding protein